MTQFTTDLLNFLAQKQDIDEFFRTSLETAMNDLLKAELSALLGYEPYHKVGYNSGNSRNGTYSRKFETKDGTVQLSIPRDRNGNFTPALIPAYGRRDDRLEEMVIKRLSVLVRQVNSLVFMTIQIQIAQLELIFMMSWKRFQLAMEAELGQTSLEQVVADAEARIKG